MVPQGLMLEHSASQHTRLGRVQEFGPGTPNNKTMFRRLQVWGNSATSALTRLFYCCARCGRCSEEREGLQCWADGSVLEHQESVEHQELSSRKKDGGDLTHPPPQIRHGVAGSCKRGGGDITLTLSCQPPYHQSPAE